MSNKANQMPALIVIGFIYNYLKNNVIDIDRLSDNYTWKIVTQNSFLSCIPGDTSQRLYDSFRKELSLKEKLVPEFHHCRNRDDLMVYLSLWLHEPLLDDDKDILLESMLIEAELR